MNESICQKTRRNWTTLSCFALVAFYSSISSLYAQGEAAVETEEAGVLATVGELMIQGGWLMLPIAGVSVLMIGISIERAISLRKSSICPQELWDEIKEMLGAGKVEEARLLLDGDQRPLARMLYSAVLRWDDSCQELTSAIEDSGQREADDLQKNLPALQGVASISPLMGLLGTVVGMIKAFLLVAKEKALGNPELLAEGIGMALTTTAAGLCVAIPAVILYYSFRGRIRTLVRHFDLVAQDLMLVHRDHNKSSAANLSTGQMKAAEVKA